MSRPPLPPFDSESAARKTRLAEDAWNTRDASRVTQADTVDSEWRNRDEMFAGREAIAAFLERKWAREIHYRLVEELRWPPGHRPDGHPGLSELGF